ncbi:MAG TPA: carbamoyltransferase C-terminal domain-containing protein [Mariniphaga sp.]|nr:carbamoyltransferase C-terminal domain-containing protein [Mariniphaga sp.]
MDNLKPTLAIYGIQDRHENEYPLYVHDHNIAIMKGGKVEYFLQQERLSRRKRDNSLHVHLKEILKDKKLLQEQYDMVFVDNVVGRTFLTQQGDVRFEAPLVEQLATVPEKGRCWWFGEERDGWTVNHELAHIFTCLPFFGNFKDNSLLVHFDGGASLSNFSAATYKNGKFEWIEYGWDLKPYSSIYNANALVFSIVGAKLPEQNSVPGKFMGYAGWGIPDEKIKIWLINNNLFQNIWSHKSIFFKKAYDDFGVVLKSFDQKSEFLQNVAASLQELFIDALLVKMQSLAKKTHTKNLYYTGGSALNIVANTRIVDSGIFDEVYIPPCTEDSGLALGAAAFVEWMKHGKVQIHKPYLNNWNIEEYNITYSNEDIEKAAALIADGNIIGICNGYGEAGPRALGNRSLLALANSKKLTAQLSMQLKGREWYRPLAPIALEQNVAYFTGKKVHPLANFMLLDFTVLPHLQHEIQGAVHADGTARFQSVSKSSGNDFMYHLLTLLNEKYGIKALINTSFNQKNEPIVHTYEDAYNAARNMGIIAFIFNGKLIHL